MKEVIIKKVTNAGLLQSACSFTSGKESHATLASMYEAEHSPIRTQLFWIEMYEIPTFVSVHLVRHKVGVEHFVRSNRDDRGGDTKADRYTPVNHAMLINAQALINMSHVRLCKKAHEETRWVMTEIRKKMFAVDGDLAMRLQPTCFYRGNVCHEMKSCGLCPHYTQIK